MKTFLFEQYGYYPSNFLNNEFELKGFKFKLLKVEVSEASVLQMEFHIDVLKNTFNGCGPYIIKNKYDKYISVYGEENYVLVSVYDRSVMLDEIVLMHNLFLKYEEHIDLNGVLELWKNRCERIEKNLSEYIDRERHPSNEYLSSIMFFLGLATNSMQYLSDTISDLGADLYGITITHKRILDFNSFDFFNPFNFIVDSPCRDIAMLYQKNLITIDELSSLLDRNNIDAKNARILMARILYRCDIFDLLETKQKLTDSSLSIQKEVIKIKKAYSLLKNKYQIRPIDWLES